MKSLDTFFMRLALGEATKGEGFTEPNPMVGCVLVRPDLNESTSDRKKRLADMQGAKITGPVPRIVGVGYHHCFGAPHAEAEALMRAGKRARGATAYVTLEPCCHYGKTPPCVDALIKAGVKRVVTAMRDPFPDVAGGGLNALRRAGIEVTVGVCRKEAERLNAPYVTRLTKKRPWIIGKWAMTLDGKIATKTGSSCWVSSEASRLRVHRIRSRMDGILIGSRTAMEDDPRLTVRLPEGEKPKRIPTRIVFDSGGTISAFSELALSARDVPLLLVFGPNALPEKKTFWEGKGAEVFSMTAPTHEQRLILLMEELSRRGMTNILCEGGGTLLGHLFDLDCLDEVYVFVAPKIVGGQSAVIPVGGEGIERMRWAVRLNNPQYEQIAEDVLIRGRIH
ncbi:MAG: bifunctional diaminohydroxyphosphoribosylaminopyrimidine deaminase/5-amino-6-(5-phosphoribosylamino)uracil reductase RibD [Thermoguttaceae bacterium]|nr:bifunctional diaminohydroxyphosphoribosylaminopyrimidine deaminase/5-amino-6-(5-phosphoribosylamino)uracil reductase RibD [Thermoguttaceae bacterium]